MANDGNESEAQGTRASPVSFRVPRIYGVARLRLGGNEPRTELTLLRHRMSQQKPSAPSGIAKLRQSIDQGNVPQSDPMNLDEFIFPNSIASPAGISPSPPEESSSALFNNSASAIPIKHKKDAQDQLHPTFPPASAPIPPQERHRNHEFDYVQRRVRKTSIDEGRVCVKASRSGGR